MLLQHDAQALLMEDERQMAPAAIAARDGHPWLQSSLERLASERVVCVRVTRDMTVQRPLGQMNGQASEEREVAPKAVLGR